MPQNPDARMEVWLPSKGIAPAFGGFTPEDGATLPPGWVHGLWL